MILVFDDQKEFRDSFKDILDKLGIKLPILECATKDEVRKIINDPEQSCLIKILIFDLATSKTEVEKLEFEILEDIKKFYYSYPIPIFIHSAFADKIEGFDNLGTMFKIKKGEDSIQQISEKIELFYSTGFLDIFCPKGSLELELYKNVNQSFKEQFQGNEIESILLSIKKSKTENLKERTKIVFDRIAVRALLQNMLNAIKLPNSEQIEEIQINAVENYYRRKRTFPIWTGDIFRKPDNSMEIVILTPRCDIVNGYCKDSFLGCKIDKIDENKLKDFGKDLNKLGQFIQDNPMHTGNKFRYLIPTPTYYGGKIDFSQPIIINKNKLDGEGSEFTYQISLSDELTNEVVRKFSSYLLRGGIMTSDISEASYYSRLLISIPTK
jgi:hypothetical protein